MAERYDVVVLGAGAAGLFCAKEAGQRGRRVAVLEGAERIGKKILISGGGRCNFTNLHCKPENFLSANPHFAKSALARFTPEDFLALVKKHGIGYHEKTLGQMFCDDSASRITGMLEAECKEGGVRIVTNAGIREITKGAEFTVRTEAGTYGAAALVVATGGLSIPAMGATSFGYEVAKRFGHTIVPTRPGLVPLVFRDSDRSRFTDLAGVSAEVVARASGPAFREKMLFTHRGLSGPAILQASSYWAAGEHVRVDLAPGRKVAAEIEGAKTRNRAAALAALQGALPRRLAVRWLEEHEPASWSNTAVREFEKGLHEWNVEPAGTEGYAKAEVTVGGVDTRELSGKTMESSKVAGLFFIGEVVDVTGHLGGFNFQWAWASAAAAGRALG